MAFLCETDLLMKIIEFMIATTNAENLPQYQIRFSLIVKYIKAFPSSPSMIREVKNLAPNLK